MLLDDRNPRGVTIAERAARAAKPRDLVHQILREGRDGVGEIVPVPRHRDAREFPMARGRVLAAGDFRRRAPKPRRRRREAGHVATRRNPHRRAKPERIEIGHAQRPAPPRLRLAPGAGFGDVAERAGAGIGHVAVEERASIRRPAGTCAVHDDQEGAGHAPIRSWISGGSSGSWSSIR